MRIINIFLSNSLTRVVLAILIDNNNNNEKKKKTSIYNCIRKREARMSSLVHGTFPYNYIGM